MIRTAITLASRGMCVFPCMPREKTPATPHGCKDATTDLDIIREWCQHEPNYNIGIATGSISKAFVIDIDGIDAEGELRKLEAVHGELPASVEVITARGRHVYFQMPDQTVRNSASKVASGIDVRGDGGYVLAPPSLHPTGRAYCWSVDCADRIAAAPDWLLTKVAEPKPKGSRPAPAPPAEWRALLGNGVGEGQRDTTITRLCGYLLRHRLDPYVALALLRSWNACSCMPPLPDADIERIVNSVAGRELKRRHNGD